MIDRRRAIATIIGLLWLNCRADDGHMLFNRFLAERLEYESNGGLHLAKWDIQNWFGNDDHKLWLKSEGDYSADQDIFGRADLQVLYSRNVDSFWDFQIGARRAFEPERTFDAVIGFQGLAPYFFEVDSALFVTEKGNVLGRLTVSYELLLSQRLILQPRIGLNVAAEDLQSRGVKAGVTEFEAGLRLRYEIEREFAPYLGVDYVEEQSLREHQHSVRAVAGFRFWY
ncbi:copper resistance protein B [Methylomonas sp. SURF-1]|uniref:Copper resistance protein B n=1 Tax=Methylomonas aurea TaxID=2952224 RepID=A0ABT1UHR0_9GAMM|nr:copper resistance protein B [Methylomonas sp. SURF-1]MCQ8181735.1 copper resistance protein B [Methylomonas sp. SURF-1]